MENSILNIGEEHDFYMLLGKKWTYPIISSMEAKKHYSFEDLISLTNRQINRTLLSNMIKDFIHKGVVCKYEKKYTLTNCGVKLKELFDSINEIIIKRKCCRN